MVENRPALNLLSHVVLILGVLIVAFPVYLTFVASTQSAQDITTARPVSLLPGSHLLETYKLALLGGNTSTGSHIPAAAPMTPQSIRANRTGPSGKRNWQTRRAASSELDRSHQL